MIKRLLVLFWLGATATGLVSAQELTVDTYQITVVTKTGSRIEGIFDDITDAAIYAGASSYGRGNTVSIPLETIRKVSLRRTSNRRAVRAGAIIGGLFFGYLTVEGLKKNPTRNNAIYGLTVLLGSGAGVAFGAVAGSITGKLTHRVIRPRDGENNLNEFRRQLEPFSLRYRMDVLNRVN